MPVDLFISYSSADRDALTRLRTHLRPLEREGLITPWSDRLLLVGDKFDERIKAELRKARLIAMILSPDFLASEYVNDVELEIAVQRHQEGTARIIPIVYRQCRWRNTPLGHLQATPTDGRPVLSASWTDKDEAWNVVTDDVARAVSSLSDPLDRSDETVKVVEMRPVDGAASSTPSRYPALEPLAVPNMRAAHTQRDKDRFLASAFAEISEVIKISAQNLSGRIEADFEQLDARRFIVSVYRDGDKVGGCTVWTGGHSFGAGSICYLGNDSGDSNTMNEWFSVEDNGNKLAFRASAVTRQEEGLLDARGVAAAIWKKLLEPMSWR